MFLYVLVSGWSCSERRLSLHSGSGSNWVQVSPNEFKSIQVSPPTVPQSSYPASVGSTDIYIYIYLYIYIGVCVLLAHGSISLAAKPCLQITVHHRQIYLFPGTENGAKTWCEIGFLGAGFVVKKIFQGLKPGTPCGPSASARTSARHTWCDTGGFKVAFL